MKESRPLKMYTLRHFLFYMGVAGVIGLAIAVATAIFDWSDGLTFGVAVVAGTISCTFAVREGLFGSSSHSGHRRI
jgi:hypothetical protein